MAEWGVESPLWSDDPQLDWVGPIESEQLGLSTSLAADLTAWNAEWERLALPTLQGGELDPVAEATWLRAGEGLVRRLRVELGQGVRVRLHP